MKLTDLEKKGKLILKLRYERSQLQKEINKHVADIKAYMDSEERRILKFGKYSFEIAKRIKRDIDFDYLDKCVQSGKIPESAFKKTYYRRLMITSSEDGSGRKMTLKGNKFVVE